ncbi:MAG: tRNA (adenosine(37)-N6)-dimethylallyltransferase MiaA [Verrucomicrobia bacterium]|nr:tRNA (adenosine(37)-N6)-dimethylallyltransferase MiaA [Verrucomicrobiota bacterium]
MPNHPLNPTAHGAFFLVGPTAVGKTEVALTVAEACHGEIVGADAFQVYEGLDLLTAKPSREALARVPHHLVGTVPLAEAFNVARYLEAAQAAIAEIRSRGRLPIIAGGTGLYVRALTRGLSDIPPASGELRAELASTPLPELLERLGTLDPEAAAAIDVQNPRRVLRALEVCLVTGKPFSSFRQEWEKQPQFEGVLLERPREELYERIERRTHSMFAEGVVEEVRAALATGGVGPTAGQVIGWREITALLRGECTQVEAIGAIQQATRRYAKRQMTWFHREPMLIPFSLSGTGDLARLIQRAAAVPR